MTWRDPLFALAVLTAMSVVLAISAIATDRQTRREIERFDFFAEQQAMLAEIDALEITHGRGLSGTHMIRLRRDAQGLWRVANRADYPANQELVNETLVALFALEALEARTARREWHLALGLTAPENLGAAIRFRASAGKRELVSLLLGRDEASEAEARLRLAQPTQNAKTFFIRKTGDDQTWLAHGRLPRNDAMAAWLDTSLPDIDATPLIAVETRAQGKTRRLAPDAQATQNWLARVSALRPIDVALRDALSFERAIRNRFVYENGLVIVARIIGTGAHLWARYDFALADKPTPQAREMRAALAKRYGAYAFKFDASVRDALIFGTEN